MSKNKIHCIILNEPKNFKPTLSGLFGHWESKIIVETIDDGSKTLSTLIKKLTHENISLLFIGYSENELNVNQDAHNKDHEKLKIEQYRNLLRRYSFDTILVCQATQNTPLKRDLSGIESCNISLDDQHNSPIFIKNLLRYAQLKKDFRISKHLLSITDRRNRWLVNITPEPIAYLYKGTHIHANAAYLSLFGFQSMPELKATSIGGLVPEKSHNMFKRFIKKQLRYSGMKTDMQQTLLMSLYTIDKTKIRASIRIAPAVINKTQCLQIWIHKIEENLLPIIENKESALPVSPWENLPEKRAKVHSPQANNTTLSQTIAKSLQPVESPQQAKSLQQAKSSQQAKTLQPTKAPHSKTNVATLASFSELRQSLTSVKLNLQPLTDTNTSSINHYFAKLQFDAQEQLHVAKQLKQSATLNPAIFWDRILLIELIKKLADNQQGKHQYLLSLRASSVNNNRFISFLVKALKTLSNKHPHIIFLLPHLLFLKHNQRTMKIKKLLQPINCSLGIYNFIPDKVSLRRVLEDKPTYISFSAKWMQSLQGDNDKLDKFSRLTDLLEQADIQIILS
ncbi:MAG: EAL domain-containing protein [Thiotrichaceae bacterium]